MLIDVWEVYPEDKQDAVIFLDEETARRQSLVCPVDLISKAKVDLSEDEIIELKALGYLWP